MKFSPGRRQIAKTLAAFTALGSALFSAANAQSLKGTKRTPSAPPQGKAQTVHEGARWLILPPTPVLPAPKRSGLATVNGTSIFFTQFGDGPPVLLLHGGLANSNYWGHQLERLAQVYSVIAMDTRGHGRSPVTSRSFSYALFADDVTGLLDFFKFRKFPLLGGAMAPLPGCNLR